MTIATAPFLRVHDLPLRGGFLDALAQRVLVYDGGLGAALLDRNLPAEDYGGSVYHGCHDHLVLSSPAIIEDLHTAFLEVGCDVLETDSFQASRHRLAEWGLADSTYAINFQAAALARKVADRFATDTHPRFVAGSIGPTGMLPSSDDPALSAVTYQQLVAIFHEQAKALVEGGADVIIIETQQDILETKAAINGCLRAFVELGYRVPLHASVSLDVSGRMLLGTDIAAVLTTLEALPIDVIGLNCSTGPEHMREPVRYLAEHSRLPVSVIPNAGIPVNENGCAVFPLQPHELAAAHQEFVERFGVSMVGGCCGTTPAHLRAVIAAIGRQAPRPRTPMHAPSVSSGVRAETLRQQPAPMLIGERVNAQGSRPVKKLLLADDYDGVLRIARRQLEAGAHALDVCVALTERADEATQMQAVVKKLSMGIEAPLVIDTTEPAVARAALETYPGRAIINSINLENGRGRIESVLPLCVEHGAAVIALTIDEAGMAHTAERKAEIAHRIHRIVTEEYGLPSDSLIFDVLTFPVTTGQEELRNTALETLAGIRRVKADLPGVFTVLGVSNLSFGVAPHARAALNSVFLHHAVQAGLDMAIINPAHVTPYAEIDTAQRVICEDLIFNRSPEALPRFIAFFEQRPAAPADEAADPYVGLTIEERIHYQILHRKKEGIEQALDEALRHRSPVDVLNSVLLPAMKDVGDRFGTGDLILPFVLQSAEVMKRAVAHLEQFLEKREGYAKGRVVLATVFGDVHDIGKNLVHTILANNGYTVYDLGKQVPLNTIIDTAIEVGADAIGLSALLVSTSKQMPLCVQELDRRGLNIPVIIGGAAINRAYGYRTLFVEDARPYAAGVFYCKDAFEGLASMDRLVDPEQRDAFLAQVRAEAEESLRRPARAAPNYDDGSVRSTTRLDVAVPVPPFWGWRTVHAIPLREAFACMDLNTLFRLHWGGKVHGDAFQRLVEQDFAPRLERMERAAIDQGWLEPVAIYGYFPCQADRNELVIFDPAALTPSPAPSPAVTGEGRTPHPRVISSPPLPSQRERGPGGEGRLREITRLRFPRRPDRDRICVADYFQPLGSGRLDVIPLQVVTVGRKPSEMLAQMQAAGEYSEVLFLHGLAMETVEGVAEWLNRRIRRELGLHAAVGLRYSWGYPACPDLEEQQKLYSLMPVSEQIGVSLTESFQFDPEATTAAFIVHHPEAKYFSVRPSE
jgi:5-methyltetrahydrofolate--homocysteine methyltransferase